MVKMDAESESQYSVMERADSTANPFDSESMYSIMQRVEGSSVSDDSDDR